MSRTKYSQAMFFQARAAEKVRNPVLQRALQKAKPLFVGKRAKGIASLADDGLAFEQLRDACEAIRNRVLGDLDVWLSIFEERAKASGAEVLWARDGEEASRLVIEVARRHGVTKATKSKSMLSEEAQRFLAENTTSRNVREVEYKNDVTTPLADIKLIYEDSDYVIAHTSELKEKVQDIMMDM